MNRDLENKIFDDILAEAFKDNLKDEMKDLPSEEELDTLYPSLPELDKKMHRCFRKGYRSGKTVLRKVAIIILIFGSTIGLCLCAPSVRAAAQQFFASICDTHIIFSIWNHDNIELQGYTIGYMTEGYSLVDAFESVDTGAYSYTFKDNGGNVIFLDYSATESAILGLDSERYEMKEVKVGEYDGRFFESNNHEKALLWSDNSYFFCLTSTLPIEEMMKIATSIRN